MVPWCCIIPSSPPNPLFTVHFTSCMLSSAFLLNPHYFVYLGSIPYIFPSRSPYRLPSDLKSSDITPLLQIHMFKCTTYICIHNILITSFTVWFQHCIPSFLADTWHSSHTFLQVFGNVISITVNGYSPSVLWIILF